MSILYILWILLPLTFYLMAIWALVKPWFGFRGRENVKQYCVQGTYCTLGLLLAIAIDTSDWFEKLVEVVSMGLLDISVARWLLYPGILVGMAYLQRVAKGEAKQRQIPASFKY